MKDLVATLRAIINTGNITALRIVYDVHGDEAINQWMIENKGYFKLRVNNHKHAVQFLEEKGKANPFLLSMPHDLLISGFHEGKKGAIRVAHELKLLDSFLFYVVDYINFYTGEMIRQCAYYKADFSVRDKNGDTLLHALARADQSFHLKSELHPSVQRDYYAWAIEALLENGLTLDSVNYKGKTPLELAQKKLNMAFVSAVSWAREHQIEPEDEGYFCLIQ